MFSYTFPDKGHQPPPNGTRVPPVLSDGLLRDFPDSMRRGGGCAAGKICADQEIVLYFPRAGRGKAGLRRKETK